MELGYSGEVVAIQNVNGEGSTIYSYPDQRNESIKIICEGDSWFTIGAIPSSNLLYELRFSKSAFLYNVAYPGDTLSNISNIKKNDDLRKLVCEKNFESKWDMILLSAGGNDLIDRMSQIVCRPTVSGSDNWLDYIDRVELANLKSLIYKGYKYISDMRFDSKNNKDAPILTHVYDYPTPRYAKARLFGIGAAGPWLYPAFKMHDVPEKFWMSVTDYVYESFVMSIIDLENKLPNFYVSSLTRGALVRADLGTEGTSGDWRNEIHPTTDGYKKIANIISHDIHKILN